MRIPKPGEFYRHFKNKLYQIITVAVHSETGEEMVVYQALYGDFKTYVRPLAMFAGQVDREKYPDVEQQYRFELVQPGTEITEGEEVPGAEERPNGYLLRFLDCDTPDGRLSLLDEMNGHVGQRELDSIYLALDMKATEGTVSDQLQSVKQYFKMMKQFDGSRLR